MKFVCVLFFDFYTHIIKSNYSCHTLLFQAFPTRLFESNKRYLNSITAVTEPWDSDRGRT